MRNSVAIIGWVAALVLTACGADLYTLPDPPPVDQRQNVSLYPGAEDAEDRNSYLESRAAALKLYSLLSAQRFEEASELLSQETRDFLAPADAGRSVAEVLASGELQRGDKLVPFEPIEALLASDLSTLQDSVEGREEHETQRRRELFAIVDGEDPRRIVMIKEAGRWVLHRTRLLDAE